VAEGSITMDYPRLREPLISVICAGLCFILAWKIDRLPDWLRLFLVFMGVVFSATALVTGFDYLVDRIADWMRSIGQAKVYPAVQYAYALKGLTAAQTDMVQRQMQQAIIGRPGEPGPAWYIRGYTIDIPLEFVADFFEWSQKTDPFLWPVRDAKEIGGGDGYMNAKQMASEFTDRIVAAGWAKDATGTHSAELTEPLATVAHRYGIEL